ncbi:MAG: hypothetical protein AB7R40_25115 [Nitrospiraceae bacterium]
MLQVREKMRAPLTTALTVLSIRRARARGEVRLIVGAGTTKYQGWVRTDTMSLNLLREETWRRLLAPESVASILAEHVWEHFWPHEAAVAARICHRFLKPGGYLRIAVPDGFHPDPEYIANVKPGGLGAGAEDHKVLYNFETISKVFVASGFSVKLYEYFDKEHRFHFTEWDPDDGMIRRSMRFDPRNNVRPLCYTSIVLDCIKHCV